MKKSKFIERITGCQPVLVRCGVGNFTDKLAELEKASGVDLSKATKWLKAVERACAEEASVYKDMSPTAWKNLSFMHPGSADLKRLRKLQTAVKKAWKS